MDRNQDQKAESRAGRVSDRMLSLALIAVFLTWLVGFTVLTAVVSDALLYLIVVASLLVAAGILRLFPRSTRDRLSELVVPSFLLWLRFCMYLFVPAFAYTVVRWVGDRRASIRLPGLLVLVVLLLWLALPLATERRRRKLLTRAPGTAVQLDYAAIVILLAAGVYSAITMEMVRAGWVQFEPTPKYPGELADFYLWHLIDSIPGGPLTTLRVDPPFSYSQHLVGALVLLFKLTIILPTIAWIRTVITVRNEAK